MNTPVVVQPGVLVRWKDRAAAYLTPSTWSRIGIGEKARRFSPAVLPLLAPVLALGVYWSLVHLLLFCGSVGGVRLECTAPGFGLELPGGPPGTSGVGELDARLAWLATVVVLVAVCGAVWVTGCGWVRGCLKHWPWYGKAGLLAFAAAVGFMVPGLELPAVQRFVLENLFFKTPSPGDAGRSAFPQGIVDVAGRLTDLCRLISIAGVTIGLAACTSVYTSCRGDHRASELSLGMRKLQNVLFAGSLLLIAAVVEFRALFLWAAASSSANAEVIKQVGSAATASLGMVYAVVLATMYYPAASILTTRARRLAVEVLDREGLPSRPMDVDRVLQDNGLVLSTPRSISTLVAVLSPLLAQAPAAALLDLLK
jgi:hypothetical protein